MDLMARQGQRGGLFSIPLSLHIGDSSVHYNKPRRDERLIGKPRQVQNNRGKSVVAATFNKLETLAIGDPFEDPGKYFLRSGAGKKALAGSFKPSGGGKTVKHSEF